MEFLIFLTFAVLTIIPMWKQCARAGIAPWWSLASALPFGIVVLLWVVAARLAPGNGMGR